MGVMTALVMNYTVNPLAGFFKRMYRGMVHSQMVLGYSRAAAELARQGYHAEAKEVMMKLKALKESN